MLQKSFGIVLHSIKYNDVSNIVDIYTERSGRASFLVKLPRSKKATVKSVLFQPLSIIEFEADYRTTSNLHRIKEAKSFYPFSSLPMIHINRLLLFLLRSFYIVRFVKRLKTSLCLHICSILFNGLMSRIKALQIFI